jgi:hypothetical protein
MESWLVIGTIKRHVIHCNGPIVRETFDAILK